MVFAVIDTNILVSALISHNSNASTVRVVESMFMGLLVPMSFLVTGNLKHFPKTPRVVTAAEMIEILGLS